MRTLTGISLTCLVLGQGFALAADAALPGSSGAAATAPATQAASDGDKVTAMESLLAAGKFNEVTLEAIAFLRGTGSDSAKTGVAWLLAESLRKKGDWAVAQEAYRKLRDRFDKKDDLYLKYDAIHQILKSSPDGVWNPEGTAAATAEPPAARTLADDAVLAEALTHMANTRAERLKSRTAPLNNARTPKEVVTLFMPLAEEFRQARVLSARMSAEPERFAGQAAGRRMADLGRRATASLQSKLDAYQAAYRAGKLTLKQREEIEACRGLCLELAATEEAFQKELAKLGGLSGLAEGERLRSDSIDRQRAYEKLAAAFLAPAWDPFGGGRGGGGFGGGPGGAPNCGTETSILRGKAAALPAFPGFVLGNRILSK